MENRYTWVPFYKELALKLVSFEDKQGELIGLINKLHETTKITSLVDKDASGTYSELKEIDPFTFIGTFNRGTSDETRTKIASTYKDFFGLSSPVPTDFDGVPMLRPDSCWFFSYLENGRQESDIPKLWKIFKIALKNNPTADPEFEKAFSDALAVKNTGLKSLTMGLFWVNPDVFCSLDSNMQTLLNLNIKKGQITATEYREIINKAKQLQAPFPKLSKEAWHRESIQETNSKPITERAADSYPNNNIDIWQDFSEKTGVPPVQVKSWINLLERKRQIIFQGPPGTGKTFVSKLFSKAYTWNASGLIEKVQFHPGYSYEDFMQGYRPEATLQGQLIFKIKDGSFKQFCSKAEETDAPCIFIIDEINRANLSSVFGELMYLLEYRNESMTLASGEKFSIPENVFIIGTMNTADRSIALMDHALRRRFAFIELKPDYSLLPANYYDKEALIQELERINASINDKDYNIGHSFFIDIHSLEDLQSVWEGEIIPYLSEYFFDQKAKLDSIQWNTIASKIAKEALLV